MLIFDLDIGHGPPLYRIDLGNRIGEKHRIPEGYACQHPDAVIAC